MADLQMQIDKLFELVEDLMKFHLLTSVLGDGQTIDRFHDEYLPGVDPAARVDANDPDVEEQLRTLVIELHAESHTIRDVNGETVTSESGDIVFEVGTDNVDG